MDRVCFQLTCLAGDRENQARRVGLDARSTRLNDQDMTRAEFQAVLFVAIAMLAGALVLLAKQYNSDFLPDLGPASADARQNALLRPASASAATPDLADRGRPPVPTPSGGNLQAPVNAPSAGNLRVPANTPSAGNFQVPVNTASASELEKLPGIGPKLAESIIAYRKQSGHFSSVEELLEVKGIGPAKLGRMRPFVELK